MSAPIESAQGAPETQFSVKRLLPLALLLAIPAIAWLTGANRLFSLDLLAQYHIALATWVASHFLLAVVAFTLFYTATTALSLPAGLFTTVAGGFLFGSLIGGTATVIGATAGATLVFLIAQSSLGTGLVKQAGPWLSKVSDGFRENAFSYLLFLRLVPAFPFWIVNLVPAVFGMPLGKYVIATFLGIIPATFAFSYLGTGLESIIAAATQTYQACLTGKTASDAMAQCHLSIDPGKLVTRELLYALVALAAISLLPILVKRFAVKRGAA